MGIYKYDRLQRWKKKSSVINENRKAGVCICVVVLFHFPKRFVKDQKKGGSFFKGFGFEDAARKCNRKQFFFYPSMLLLRLLLLLLFYN